MRHIKPCTFHFAHRTFAHWTFSLWTFAHQIFAHLHNGQLHIWQWTLHKMHIGHLHIGQLYNGHCTFDNGTLEICSLDICCSKLCTRNLSRTEHTLIIDHLRARQFCALWSAAEIIRHIIIKVVQNAEFYMFIYICSKRRLSHNMASLISCAHYPRSCATLCLARRPTPPKSGQLPQPTFMSFGQFD